MAFLKLQFKPGLNRDQTNYSNEGGWVACDKVRFRSGFPQKIGGWRATTTNKFIGICRQMFGWITTYSENLLALGTHKKAYIELNGAFNDITPLRATFTTPDTDSCLTIYENSTKVLVTLVGHGALEGDYVNISGVQPPAGYADLFGIPLAEVNTDKEVIEVVDADNFYISVSTPAKLFGAWSGGTWGSGPWGQGLSAGPSATALGGDAITMLFDIHAGNPITVYGYGWSTSTWGRGAWGSSSQPPIALLQRDWWFDQFDNDLVMNYRNGPIYYWERGAAPQVDTPLAQRAVLMSSMAGAQDVPDIAMQVMVSQNDRHLIAFGATPFGGGDFDPLLIRWATQDNPLVWTPEVTNSAGFLRVSRGSRIVRAMPTRQEILVWTESNLYTLQFLGTTDVFSLQEYADNISIASPRAVATANNVTYWMGRDKFYAYAGRVESMPCTLRHHVFRNLNKDQLDQVFATTNEEFHEIWWFYPSLESTRVDSYVIYNYIEQIWYYGSLERTAWLDSPLRTSPQAVGYENTLFDQEVGVDADGAPMVAFLQSSDFDIYDGEDLVLSKRILPDLDFTGSTADTPKVSFAVRPRNFPGGSYVEDPFDSRHVVQTTVDRYTEQIFIRARARQMALRISSEDLGVHWQLGSPRLDVRPSGKR